MKFKWYTHVLLVGAHLALVSASVYPTQPVQATVWTADEPMLVSWIEDWKYPPLHDIGPLDIALWSDADTYLAPLASGVDPMAKTTWVTAPGRAWRPGSKYALRFTTNRPADFMVYSADFVMLPGSRTVGSTTGAGTPVVALVTQTSAGNGTAGTGTATGTGAPGAGTTGSGIATTSVTAGSTSAPTPTTNTSAFKTTATRSGSTTPSGTGVQRAANAVRRGLDVEKLKFRFVFVIWPVLMGITMAL